MIEQCTGKAGGVQTESGPGFDRGQHDCVDNKVFFWWILTLGSSDVTRLRSNGDVILFVENALQEVLGSLYHHQSKGYDQVDGQVRLYSLASSCLANFSQIMSLQPSHGAGVCPLSKRAGCWRTNVAAISSKLATW